MPHAPRHDKQKSKNLALALALLGLCFLFYLITLVKFDLSKFGQFFGA